MKTLCIYHGACDDGFAAAWIVRKALGAGNVDFHPGVYGESPPPVANRDVILVDFSYKRPVIEDISFEAKSVLILDHHKTAQSELASLAPPPPDFRTWRSAVWIAPELVEAEPDIKACGPVAALFDTERSGAGMAWDYFYGPSPRPAFINYVEDRDLWRKALPHGDEFTIALRSYPQDFDVWDQLFPSLFGYGSDEEAVAALVAEGRAIQRYYRLRIEDLKRAAYPAIITASMPVEGPGPPGTRYRIVGWRVMIANAPYFAASEVAGELSAADGFSFGACYFEAGPGRWQYSLRSRGDFDVSEVARAFGGGGHKNAAGFTVSNRVHCAELP